MGMFTTFQPLPWCVVILTIIQDRQYRHNSLDNNYWSHEYDYIVVGAGAAGSVVASRLAEDIANQVLLIEAGGPQTLRSDIPALQPSLRDTELDWQYPLVSQEFAYLAFKNQTMTVPRGKVFGGSSVLNSMNYYRANEAYYKLWSDTTGVEGWHFEDVLPYFKKSENNLDEQIVAQYPEYHRRGGLMTVTTADPDPVMQNYMIAANLSGSPPTFPDGRQPFGSALMQRTIKDGVRQSSSVAFLESRTQFNRQSIGNSLVTRILFDEQRKAIGVEFYRNNQYYKVKARKEVMVSAGAVGSPKLLMNSGIGPKEHLDDLNIPVVSALPVGTFDRPIYVDINFDIKDQSLVPKPLETQDNYRQYYINKSGPLAYKISGVTCFEQMQYPNYPGLSNGCILPRTGYSGTDLEKMVKNFKQPHLWRDYYRPYMNRTVFEMLSVLRIPKGKGTIRLRSSDPLDQPLIDPCFFCDQQDLDDLIQTVKLGIDIVNSSHMSQFVENYAKPIPGCDPCPDNFYCDSYIKCVIQSFTQYLHLVGGCQMGVSGQPNAVVDNKLRVLGVSGLRVIDSSVIPVPAEQSYAITMMVGEYGAQLVKDN